MKIASDIDHSTFEIEDGVLKLIAAIEAQIHPMKSEDAEQTNGANGANATLDKPCHLKLLNLHRNTHNQD